MMNISVKFSTQSTYIIFKEIACTRKHSFYFYFQAMHVAVATKSEMLTVLVLSSTQKLVINQGKTL